MLIGLYRHRLYYRSRKWRRRLVQSTSTEARVKVLEIAKQLEPTQLIGRFVLAFLPGLIVSVVLTATGPTGSYMLGENCHLGPRIHGPYVVYVVVYGGALIFGLIRIRKLAEAWGLRREVFYLIIYGGIAAFFYLILTLLLQPAVNDQDSLAFLWWAMIMIYQIRAILLPGLMNLPLIVAVSRAAPESADYPLQDLLNSKDGYQFFFLYCLIEYSDENPTCWRAMQTFKTKTSYPSFMDIFSKHLSVDAPCPVNLPAHALREIRDFASSINSEVPLEKLQSAYDTVQLELIQLMSDSYERFKRHALYRRFRKGERPPTTLSSAQDDALSDESDDISRVASWSHTENSKGQRKDLNSSGHTPKREHKSKSKTVELSELTEQRLESSRREASNLPGAAMERESVVGEGPIGEESTRDLEPHSVE